MKKKYMRFCITMTILLSSFAGVAQSRDSLEIVNVTQEFLTAFRNFDWTNFRNAFAADATIFFPGGEDGKRKTGTAEIEKTWTTEFPEFIDTTKKFDLKIEPRDFHIQLYGTTAIVTFSMGEGNKFLSRRTLIFNKQSMGWKIVHLHASTVYP